MKYLMIIGAVFTVGCSSAQINYQSQYCYTDETIVAENGNTVSSKTRLECTDRPGQQTAIQRAGIDAGCREFFYPEIRRGRQVMARGVVCEKLDGTSEIVNIDGNIR